VVSIIVLLQIDGYCPGAAAPHIDVDEAAVQRSIGIDRLAASQIRRDDEFDVDAPLARAVLVAYALHVVGAKIDFPATQRVV
jgi:hypothetical protein